MIIMKLRLRHNITIAAICMLAVMDAAAQKSEFNPVTTGVTSLSIAPDARGASMGDLGAATDPDANSQFWNPSKYAFAYSKAGVSLSYTPWLRKLVNDIFLANVAGYWKLGSQDNQALSASLRYFSLGEVNTGGGPNGIGGQSINPYELSFDIGYSRKLSDKFSMGVVFRYIYSDLGFPESDAEAPMVGASAFSADISGYYTTYPVIGPKAPSRGGAPCREVHQVATWCTGRASFTRKSAPSSHLVHIGAPFSYREVHQVATWCMPPAPGAEKRAK